MSFSEFLKSPTVGDYLALRRARREGREPGRRIAPFAGVRVEGDTVVYERRAYPLAGLCAEVETAGQFRTRLSATRLALVGPLALFARKKVDDRELYLMVTTTAGPFVVPVDPKRGLEARQFAALLTTLGQ